MELLQRLYPCPYANRHATMILLVTIVFAVAHSQPDWDEPAGRRFPVSSDEEINNLQDTLLPGDYMVMQPGEWMSPNIRLTANGTSDESMKIYLLVEEPGTVILTGNVRIRLAGDNQEIRGIWLDGTTEKEDDYPIIFEKGTTSNRLTNSAITNFNRPAVPAPEMHYWIDISGSYHILDWNDFIDKVTIGELMRIQANRDISILDSWGHYIRYNYFGPRPPTATGDNGEGMHIGNSWAESLDFNVTVEFNLFEEFDGEIECVSVKTGNNVVRYNTFRNSACTITLRHGNGTTVEENYFLCNGKFHCGGVRMHGHDHLIRNNYIEEEYYDRGVIAGVSLYQGISDDWMRDINQNSVITNNVMVNCSRCIAMGWLGLSGGDQIPTDIKFIQNVFTARTPDDYVYLEVDQENTYWEDNVGWNGIIDNEEDIGDGLRRQDPDLQFDEEFAIWVPNPDVTGWEFQMTYKSLHRSDVGTNWLDTFKDQ